MKALVLSSGGVDSTTCLGLAVDKYGSDNVIALAITYGQRHTKEIEAAKAVAAYYHVEMLHLDLTPIFQYSDCSLLSHSGNSRGILRRTAAAQRWQAGFDLCAFP